MPVREFVAVTVNRFTTVSVINGRYTVIRPLCNGRYILTVTTVTYRPHQYGRLSAAPFNSCSLLYTLRQLVRFCQQDFGEFPRPSWAVGSYSSSPQAGGTLQVLVDKTLRMTSRLRVYADLNNNQTKCIKKAS